VRRDARGDTFATLLLLLLLLLKMKMKMKMKTKTLIDSEADEMCSLLCRYYDDKRMTAAAAATTTPALAATLPAHHECPSTNTCVE